MDTTFIDAVSPSSNGQSVRSIDKVVTSIQAKEGAGFSIRRPFPTQSLSFIDPFLLLDHMEPLKLVPGQAKGAPDHPHRGFETVTYLLEGKMHHEDSAGNSGHLEAGDVQWMTAGAGVIHSEMPDVEYFKDGGVLHGFQIWVNLPAVDKMMPPRYQDIPSRMIPVVQNDEGTIRVKVIAGESMGASAVIDTRTPITFLHVDIKSRANFLQSLPENYNVMAYIISGSGTFGDPKAETVEASADQLVVFRKGGKNVRFAESEGGTLSLLLLAGAPLGEPVARYGPFVMNTEEEIKQAMRDYQSGKLGSIERGSKR
ncbi:MAG: pirin family protein [Candidatus Obscuribacterales bacterium]|nr:pirin family protein [Candidatus Obscuribacterales bacterium]